MCLAPIWLAFPMNFNPLRVWFLISCSKIHLFILPLPTTLVANLNTQWPCRFNMQLGLLKNVPRPLVRSTGSWWSLTQQQNTYFFPNYLLWKADGSFWRMYTHVPVRACMFSSLFWQFSQSLFVALQRGESVESSLQRYILDEDVQICLISICMPVEPSAALFILNHFPSVSVN